MNMKLENLIIYHETNAVNKYQSEDYKKIEADTAKYLKELKEFRAAGVVEKRQVMELLSKYKDIDEIYMRIAALIPFAPEIRKCHGCMGAAFNDCHECNKTFNPQIDKMMQEERKK